MFDQEKFEKWEEETHIPQSIMDMVNFIGEKIGYPVEEETITLRNRGGYPYAYAKGFCVTHCTSSMADGPSPDYGAVFKKFIKGLDFVLEDSYGDNGMDSDTNWHDTFWTDVFAYKPSQVSDEEFTYYTDDECFDDEEY